MAEGYSSSSETEEYPLSFEEVLEWIEDCESGNIDNVELLWKKQGWDIKKLYAKMTPLTLASFKGHLAEVKVLLQNGADVNERDKDGSTPLSASCMLGHSDVAVELIKQGAEVNFKTGEKGLTPLIIASICKRSNIIKILLENGADVNAKINWGWTALHYAAIRNHKEAIITLLQNGADPNTTAVDGNTAMDLAKDQEIKDMLTRAKKNRLTREESDEGKRQNYSNFAEYLAKDRERCDDEIEQLREEKEKLLRAQQRVEESILSRLDELAQSVKDIPPRLTRNEFNYRTNIKTKNYNYGENAGYQFFNVGQSKLAGGLSSEVGEGVVHLTIRIAQLESELRIKDRYIEKLKNSKMDVKGESSSAGLTEETPDKLRERIERLTRDLRLLEKELQRTKGEKAAQSKELGRTKEDRDRLAKRVKIIEAEKEALMVELHELRERVSRSKAINVQQRVMILEMETRLKELKVSMEWNPKTEKDELQ